MPCNTLKVRRNVGSSRRKSGIDLKSTRERRIVQLDFQLSLVSLTKSVEQRALYLLEIEVGC